MNLHINPAWFGTAWKILESERGPTVREIQDATCAYFGVKRSEIMSPRRDKLVSNARMMAIYLSCELTDRSLPEVGRMFNRDHSTIHHCRKKMRRQVVENEFFECAASELKEIIGGAGHE